MVVALEVIHAVWAREIPPPDNHLPSLGYGERVKAKERKTTLLFGEISLQDGTLANRGRIHGWWWRLQGLFYGPKPKVDFTSFSEVQVKWEKSIKGEERKLCKGDEHLHQSTVYKSGQVPRRTALGLPARQMEPKEALIHFWWQRAGIFQRDSMV